MSESMRVYSALLALLLLAAPPTEAAPACTSLTKRKCARAHECVWSGRKCANKPPVPPPPQNGTVLCSDTCPWAHDKSCDDGGPGAGFATCAFGTDCADCGPRRGPPPPPPPPASAPGFTIDLRFVKEVTPAVRAAFEQGKRRLEELIVGDIGRETARIPAGHFVCGMSYPGSQVAVTTWIDDVLVFAEVGKIDGPGGILGGAGPCTMDADKFIRSGYMQFDAADLEQLAAEGALASVVTHELLHILGIGTQWEGLAARTRLLTTSPPLRYTGPKGIEGHARVGGEGLPYVEEKGGPGTARGHWDNDKYTTDKATEIMTGYLKIGLISAISPLTDGALQDLGYQTDPKKVDAFVIAPGAAPKGPQREISDLVLNVPVTTVETVSWRDMPEEVRDKVRQTPENGFDDEL